MSDHTEIAWCDSTFNGWIGCTKVGPGCDHCYAEADFDLRRHRVKWGAGNPRSRTSPANWKKPLRWNATKFFECPDCGLRGDARMMGDEPKDCKHLNAVPARRRVFCASLADVFDNEVPRAWRYDLLWLISNTPNLDWLLLTKRIGNAHRMLEDECYRMGFPWSPERWPHVWLGATICNQEEADRDISKLLAVPAAVRWLSMEPLLGPVDLPVNLIYSDILPGGWIRERKAIEWVVVGGESGQHARPMHPAWARSLRDQCAAAGTPFLFKQWGEWAPTWTEAHAHLGLGCPPDPAGIEAIAGTRMGQYPYESIWPVVKVGKKAAGRLLGGVLHDAYPKSCEKFKEITK